MTPSDGGDHSGWYAMAVSLIAVVGGLLGLRKKASSDSVQIAKDRSEVAEVENAQQEVARLRRQAVKDAEKIAGLERDNLHLSSELLHARHYADKYMQSLAQRAGTDFADLTEIPKPPPKRR